METLHHWMILKDEVNACQSCYLASKHKLLDRGNRNARIMIVSDAPSPADIREGKILSGTNGKLIEGILTLADINLNDVYITALVNCPSSKAPKPQAVDVCINCLRKQFRLVKPEIVICLGSVAAKRLISEDFRLAKDHGVLTAKGKIMFMGTYNPSAAAYNEMFKHNILEDFLKIRDFCNTYPPFSEK